MHKPHGMSRKDARNLVTIVREFLRRPDAIVTFQGDWASGHYGERTEEGFEFTSIEAYSNKDGTYTVTVYTQARDCDGRTSSENTYTVRRTGKRSRFYMSRDWETNRPAGKFYSRGLFKIVASGRSEYRDYQAEAAGY